MPNWLTIDFLMQNWQPLVVALVLGYILGWLITGMPNSRRAREAEERNADVEARMRRSERELTEVRVQGETGKTRLSALQSDLDAANVRIAGFEEAAKDFATASLRQAEAMTGSSEETDANDQEFPSTQDALPADESLVDDVDGGGEVKGEEGSEWSDEASDADVAAPYVVAAVARAAEVHHGEQDDSDDNETDITSRFRSIAHQVEPVTVPDNRDIALAEAYAHAATLQNELEKSDNALRMQQADLEALRAQLQVANAARHELETRLVRAREDVASELAVLASTMIKMKDDALSRADAKIAALANEIDAVRTEAVRTEAVRTEAGRNAASRSLEIHHDQAIDDWGTVSETLDDQTDEEASARD